MNKPTPTAKLTIEDKVSLDLPIYKSTLGQDVIAVDQLLGKGYFTYDPGYATTAAVTSEITYIDGAKGILLHRGYPIEQLAEHSSYTELSYLLLKKELPTSKQHDEFIKTLYRDSFSPRSLQLQTSQFQRNAHPMALLCSLTGALSASFHDEFEFTNKESREVAAHRLVALMPTLGAMAYRHITDKRFVEPIAENSFIENFLHMMFAGPDATSQITPAHAEALDLIFLLHADHEQNASTSSVRLVGSTGANPYAAITAGIAALWGPAHGGANEAVVNMLKTIGSVDNLDGYIARAKDKDDPFRLMGFGHRVYKNFDPRATVLRQMTYRVLETLKDTEDERALFDLARKLESIALEDPYFIEKKLYPNVDFYSGIILAAMGIPTNMFTAIFAMARTVGWVANWLEMCEAESFRISRPRQLYTGHKKRDYPA